MIIKKSPALTILPGLIEKGAKIRAYDPEAIKDATTVRGYFVSIELNGKIMKKH